MKGTERLNDGSGKLEKGSEELAEGQEQAETSAGGLVDSTGELSKRIRTGAHEEIQRSCSTNSKASRRRTRNSPKPPNDRSNSPPTSKTSTAKPKATSTMPRACTRSRANSSPAQTTSMKATNELHKGTGELHKEAQAAAGRARRTPGRPVQARQRDQRTSGRLGNAEVEPRRRLPSLLPAAVEPAEDQRQGHQGRRRHDEESQQDQHPVAGPLRLRLLRPLGDRRRAAGRTGEGQRSDQPQERRPGRRDHGDLQIHLQHAGLEEPRSPPQGRRETARARTRTSKRASPAAPPSSPTTTRSPGNGSRWSCSRSRSSPC